ncbi:YadA-like family protein, partial [Variovorax sp. J22P240]|uniref:YadA-like family protein n=1 Tax=Variovorax sp. J22P240 TaxID=3053514 RepID=UPI0025756B87
VNNEAHYDGPITQDTHIVNKQYVDQSVTEVSTIANKGWNISAQGANSTNVAPGETVDLKNTDGNVVVSKKADSDDVTFDLAKDINVNSVTMGNTVLNQNGLTIFNGPSITINGINAGGSKITNVGTGTDPTDAVNVGQLKDTVKESTQDAVMYDNSTHTSVTLNKGGSPTTITNVANGVNDSDAVNMSQLNALDNRVTNVEGDVKNLGDQINNISNGGGIKYFHANSTGNDSSATGQDAVAVGVEAVASGDKSMAMGAGSSASVANSVALGAGSVANKAATPVNNAQVGNMNYGGFAGSKPTGVVSVGSEGAERQITNVAAGRITADSTDAVNGSQLYSVADGLNKKIDNSIQYDTKTNPDGTQKPGDGSDITLKGDDGTQIHNVADGTAPNDAATVGQLDNAVAGINKQMQGLSERVETVNKDANAGTAGAMAMAGMPQATIPGKSMAAAGVAAYQGEAALAVGVSKLSDNGRWIVKLSGTANTRGKVGVAGGVGFHW